VSFDGWISEVWPVRDEKSRHPSSTDPYITIAAGTQGVKLVPGNRRTIFVTCGLLQESLRTHCLMYLCCIAMNVSCKMLFTLYLLLY
jgi:hypothetical protein